MCLRHSVSDHDYGDKWRHDHCHRDSHRDCHGVAVSFTVAVAVTVTVALAVALAIAVAVTLAIAVTITIADDHHAAHARALHGDGLALARQRRNGERGYHRELRPIGDAHRLADVGATDGLPLHGLVGGRL